MSKAKPREKKAGKRMTKKQLAEVLAALFQQHPNEELKQKYLLSLLLHSKVVEHLF